MSFILDALKKSENERSRQNGPTLLEARVVAPRPRLPVWGIVIGIALIGNVALLIYLALRSTPQAVMPATAASRPAPVPASPLSPAATPGPSAIHRDADTSVLPDPAQPLTPMPPASVPPPPSRATDTWQVAPPRGAAAVGTESADPELGLPGYGELTASGIGLPELRLSLHVYDPDASRRYILLNSTRLREGESTPDGVRLEHITENGVVLSWRNRRFTLQRGE